MAGYEDYEMKSSDQKSGRVIEEPDNGHDIARKMGHGQELTEKFGLASMIGFSCTIMVTWEGVLFVYQYGMYDGGPLGSIIQYIFCWIGYTLVALCLAEMNSIWPTAGGQYHWVSELAPQSLRRPLSYMTGWLLVLGWQADLASAAYLGGTIIQGMVVLNYPDYVFHRWHGTLILYVVVLFAGFFNTVLIRLLPFAEGTILAIHILGWFAVLVSMIVMGNRATDAEVWGLWLNLGGYSSGLSYFVGLTGPVFAFMGADGASHMSEEVSKPRTTVPLALVSSITINGFLGFGMLIALLYCQGSIEQNLSSTTGFPFIEAFLQSLRSVPWATAWTALLLALLIFANVAVLAATSRTTFAFARDGGLPFSHYIGHLHERTKLPIWAIALTVLITMLLGLINIGSSTAFNAVISLVVAAYYSSYFNAISLLLVRKLTGSAPEPGPWRMGKITGIVVNILALVYIVIVFIFSFFPIALPVTLSSMNWAVVLYFGMVLIGAVLYFVRGKHFREPRFLYERQE